MFTFIKIAYHQVLHGRTIERVVHKPYSRRTDELPQQDGARSNPWERELARLALPRDPNERRRHLRSQLPRPSADLEKSQRKQGTLTDLKIWWGQATSPTKPATPDLGSFAPAPSKRRSRWFQ
jgi:hypothetical protein